MRWLKLLLIGCVTWTANTEDPQREKKGLTWAEILGGAPPRPIATTVPPSYTPNEISRTLSDARDPSLMEDEYASEYDYHYDYDDSFFENPDYEYVDTEDENYVPPPKVEKEGNDGNQTADRRTLDFFYHLFRDQFRNGQNEGRESTTRRPSLIEAVFETIDNHIIEDLREWTNDPIPQNANALNFKHAKKNKKVLATPSIEPVTPDNNIVLITDEQGNQQIVTIHDIVSSLSHLDEQTLTNLILDPSFNERSSQSFDDQVPNYIASGSENIPVAQNTQTVVPEEVARPTRHTGSTSTPKEEEEEVYVVRDEHGNIQLITLDDILSSLSLLDEDSVHSLLFEDAPPPGAATTASQNSVPPSVSKPIAAPNVIASVLPKATTTKPSPTSKSTTTTPVPRPTTLTTQAPKSAPVLSDNTTPREPIRPKKKPLPSVSHDKHGNLRVLAHPGSVTVDLKDLSWKANDELVREPTTPAPFYVDGSLVKTDADGNIHITPNSDQPFSLDIQRIISIAEQANSPARPDAEKDEDSVQQEIPTEEPPNRGQELLSYLAGLENFLPAPILPRPVRATAPYSKTSPYGPASVNSVRESILQALNHQRTPQKTTTPQPPVQPLIQRLVQPVVQPIVQPIVQAVTRPASQLSSSGGIGATLSNFLSSFVGQPTVQHTEVVPQIVEKTPEEEEFIKIVVRQQAPNSFDTTFGDVTIPLPKAIHFRPTPAPQPETTTAAQISSRLDIPSPWQALSPLIQRSLQLQANNVPVFIPPGARARSATQQPAAAARSDSGPIFRTDKVSVKAKQAAERQDIAQLLRRNRILANPIARADRRVSDSENSNRRSGSGPILRTDRNTPIRVITKEVEPPKPSLSSVLKGLPPSVLESLRKQAQGSRTAQASNLENKEEEEEIDEESDTAPRQKRQPANTRDRSSYAEDPQYDHGSTGYGYGPDGDTGDPWFDIYLLADLTKVYKIGDSNLSVKSPIIGDPSYFVDTRHHEHYH